MAHILFTIVSKIVMGYEILKYTLANILFANVQTWILPMVGSRTLCYEHFPVGFFDEHTKDVRDAVGAVFVRTSCYCEVLLCIDVFID